MWHAVDWMTWKVTWVGSTWNPYLKLSLVTGVAVTWGETTDNWLLKKYFQKSNPLERSVLYTVLPINFKMCLAFVQSIVWLDFWWFFFLSYKYMIGIVFHRYILPYGWMTRWVEPLSLSFIFFIFPSGLRWCIAIQNASLTATLQL